MSKENFQRHVGLFGITGSGKTIACQNLVRGLLKEGVPFLIVDWKRAYRNVAPQEIEVFSIGRKSANAISWNPLRPPPGVNPRNWIGVVAETLERSHLSGQGSGHILLDLLDARFEKMGFYKDTQPEIYPNFFDIKEDLVKLNKRGRQGLWQDTAERIVRSLTFGSSGSAMNARNPIKMEELLNKPVIFELDQELPRPIRTFFSEIVLRFIHLQRLYEGESNTLKHVLVMEEIHNLFPKSQFEKSSTSGLETLARELRSFGQSLVAISQHPSLLPTYLLGNMNTLIFLALQHADDVESARKALFLDRSEEKIFGWLKVGEGIVRIQGRVSPCHVRFPFTRD